MILVKLKVYPAFGFIAIFSIVAAGFTYPVQAGPAAASNEAGQDAVLFRTQVADANQDAAAQLFAEAFSLYKVGLYREAIQRFEGGLTLDPKNQAAQYYIARAIVDGYPSNFQENIDRVLSHLDAAIELNPQSKYGALAQSLLNGFEKPLVHRRRFDRHWCLSDYLTREWNKNEAHPEDFQTFAEAIDFRFNESGKLTGAILKTIGGVRELHFTSVTYVDRNDVYLFSNTWHVEDTEEDSVDARRTLELKAIEEKGAAYDLKLDSYLYADPEPNLLFAITTGQGKFAGSGIYELCR